MQMTIGESKFDVPTGNYAAKLLTCEERPSKRPDWGPQYAWNFEITEGPHAGKMATCWTPTFPALNNGLGKLLREMMGRPLSVGDALTSEQFVGRPFLITVGLNKAGTNTRVIFVQPVGSPQAAAAVATGPASQPAPAAPAPATVPGVFAGSPIAAPPPRRPQPASPPSAASVLKVDRQFFVFESDDAALSVQKSESDLSHWMATNKLDPASVTCCLVGEQEYRTAADYGVQAIPY